MKSKALLDRLRQVKSERGGELVAKAVVQLDDEALRFVTGGIEDDGGTYSGTSSGNTCDTVRVCCCPIVIKR
jgi:hypothetical protein